MKTGSKLKEARLARGWSQAELARRAGVSKDTITRLDRADYEPRWTYVLPKLAAALGCELSDLVDGPIVVVEAGDVAPEDVARDFEAFWAALTPEERDRYRQYLRSYVEERAA